MDLEERKLHLKKEFEKVFKEESTDFFTSSGRVELLGNHTDHNHGLVLVGAVNLDILSATKKRNDNKIVVYSEGYPCITVDLNDLKIHQDEKGFSIALVRGILSRCKEENLAIGGFSCFMNSTVAPGAGVSSSAAYECMIIAVLNEYYNNNKITPIEMAKIAQYAESTYFMKPCGLLDQCGVSFGGVNRIDFKSINEPKVQSLKVSFDPYRMVLVNTGGNHSSLTDQYKSITDEMRQVANFFKKDYLSEVREGDFLQKLPELRKVVSDRAIMRASHFFMENQIVERGFNCLKNNDIEGFLKAINDSGRDSFELLQNNINVTSTNQNIALGIGITREILSRGAVRVHGGGFEGTILAFVHKDDLKQYHMVMEKIFGAKNVHDVEIRNFGASKLN